jgi:predicted ATPase/class 3 adenylate cyclase
MSDLPSGTVTFLFTDTDVAAGPMGSDVDAARAAIERHDEILCQSIEGNGGYVFKRIGVAFQAAFATASQALAAAAATQRALNAEQWGTGGPVRVRMALHTGVTDERGGEYVGPLLNRVARVLAAGHPGQVLLTEATQALARDGLPPGMDLRDLGEHRLRDLVRPERIFQLIAPGLPDEFPPLKTLTGHLHNLPVQPTSLIGREKEVAECLALLRREDVRLLTLTGAGGAGKTRLGLQVAAELVDDFADGVFFVSLASVSDPNLVAPTIAHTLGIREGGGQTLIEALGDYLRNKQMLLVLDNFEQVVGAGPLVVELIQHAPQLKVLVTTRAVLRVSIEQEYRVPSLTLPDLHELPPPEALRHYPAVALFIARAQALKPDFTLDASNAAAVAEICVRLDGLPLAIELAAARIKIMTPQAIAARLTARLKLLTGGVRDLPVRQQALRSTIDWSYELLAGGEQRLFRRVAVLMGGRTLEAIEAVCNPAGDLEMDTLDAVSSLVDKSLLFERESPDGEVRFWMLETIQEYAAEALEKSGEAEVLRRRHAAFFLELAERAEPELTGARQAAWLEQLEREHGNFRAALAWAGLQSESITALRIAGALMRFWEVRGYLSEGRHWAEAALAIPTAAGTRASGGAAPSDGAGTPEAARANALSAAGRLISLQGDYRRAAVLWEESLALAAQMGDKRGMTRAYLNLGIIREELGDDAGATEMYEHSLNLAREIDDSRGIAMALANLGVRKQHCGDYDGARPMHQESLAILRGLNDRRAIAVELGNLAEVALAQGHLEEAQALYLESLQLLHELGDKVYTAYFLAGLAAVACGRGNAERAGRLFGATEALREAIGAPLPPSERQVYDLQQRTARAHLDQAVFLPAWTAGREMGLEEALDYAFNTCT